jgi:hypothetical protein
MARQHDYDHVTKQERCFSLDAVRSARVHISPVNVTFDSPSGGGLYLKRVDKRTGQP